MSHVITHPCPWLRIQASRFRLPPAQPTRRCQRPVAQTPGQCPTPRRHRRRSGRRWRRRGDCCCLAFDEWPAGSHYCCTAAKQPKRLRSRQRPALPEWQLSAWNVPENQTMRKTEMAQINQTRDVLKIEYHVIEIVQ